MQKWKQQLVRECLCCNQQDRKKLSLCFKVTYEGLFYCNSRGRSLRDCHWLQGWQDNCNVRTLLHTVSDRWQLRPRESRDEEQAAVIR
jgi:hypothetical protein